MKIKCPFCKHIYDPEAQKNQCPSCGKKLLAPPVKGLSKPPPAPARKMNVMAHKPVRIEPPDLPEPEPDAPKPPTRRMRQPVPPPPVAATAPAAPAATPTAKTVTPGHALVISTRKVGADKFDTVVHMPLGMARTSPLVAEHVKKLVQAAGLNFDDLCRSAEKSGQLGGLVEIKTKTEIVRLAVETMV